MPKVGLSAADADLRLQGLLRLPDVLRLLGISRSTLYAGIADGSFPKPVQIGKRAVGWRVKDIEELLASLV